MRRIDSGLIPRTTDEIRLFVKARDEAVRLPFFLDYYFAMGVDRVFIIDNGSTDATTEIAHSFENVHVFQTYESFKNYPLWFDVMLKRYGTGNWCVVADVDEIIALPTSADNSLRDVIGYLEKTNRTAVRSFLLDMYSVGPLSDIPAYRAGEDPLCVCPMFDSSFTVEQVDVHNPVTLSAFSSSRFSGGMRQRLFSLDVNLSKVVLFKMRPGVWLAPGAHHLYGASFCDLRLASLHFKYLPGTLGRITTDASRGQHAGGAAYLRPIVQKLKSGAISRFDYPDSTRFKNLEQLSHLGIANVPGAFERHQNP